MAKVHLQGNKAIEKAPRALCSQRSLGNGQSVFNSRAKYRNMTSEIVKLDVFKTIPAANRCTHCCDNLLERRIANAKRDGRQAPKTYNEGWEQ